MASVVHTFPTDCFLYENCFILINFSLTSSQRVDEQTNIGADDGLVLNKQQTFIWSNEVEGSCHIYAYHCLGVLWKITQTQQLYIPEECWRTSGFND